MPGAAYPHDRVAAVLGRNAWFSRCPAELRRQLIRHAQVSTVEAGHWLYDAGDEARGLYGVLSGSVTTHVGLDNGENVPVNISGPGPIFGYAAQVLGGHRVTTAVARERSEIIFVPQHALASIAHDIPTLWLHFAGLATEHLVAALRTTVARTHETPAARVALHLRLMAGNNKPPVDLAITQDELAELTGLSRKTVNQVLKDFERSGVLEAGYRKLCIVDVKRLR